MSTSAAEINTVAPQPGPASIMVKDKLSRYVIGAPSTRDLIRNVPLCSPAPAVVNRPPTMSENGASQQPISIAHEVPKREQPMRLAPSIRSSIPPALNYNYVIFSAQVHIDLRRHTQQTAHTIGKRRNCQGALSHVHLDSFRHKANGKMQFRQVPQWVSHLSHKKKGKSQDNLGIPMFPYASCRNAPSKGIRKDHARLVIGWA